MLSSGFDIDNDPEASSTVTIQVTDAAPDQTVTTPWNAAGCRFLYLYIEVDYLFTGTGTGTTAARVHLDQAVGQPGDTFITVTDTDDAGSFTGSSHVLLSRDNPGAVAATLGLDASSTIDGTLTLDAKMLGCIE